jgi:hypothetical protein
MTGDGRQPFVVYAFWHVGVAISDALLAAIHAAWTGPDDDLCSSIEPGDVLQLSFDVLADDFDAAARSARSTLNDLASAVGLRGRLVRLIGYTEDSQYEATIE